MASEIERKFLVEVAGWRLSYSVRLRQGYLNRDKHRTVRVRIAGAKAFLTIKGVPQGITRAEFEYEIPFADAEQILKLSDGPVIEKNRHVIVHEGFEKKKDKNQDDKARHDNTEKEQTSEDQP